MLGDSCGTLILEGDQFEDKLYFHQGVNLIGRNHAKTNITIRDKSISTNHAQLIVKGRKFYVVDTGSKNGVFINNFDRQIENNVQVEIDPKIDIVYFAQIKCKIIPKEQNQSKDQTNHLNKGIEVKQKVENIDEQSQQNKHKQLLKVVKNQKEEQKKQKRKIQNSKKQFHPQRKGSKQQAKQKQEKKKNKNKKYSKSIKSQNVYENQTLPQMDNAQEQRQSRANKQNKGNKEKQGQKQKVSKQKQKISKQKIDKQKVSKQKVSKQNIIKQKNQKEEKKIQKQKRPQVEHKSFYSRKNNEKKSFSGETKGKKNKKKREKSIQHKRQDENSQGKLGQLMRKKQKQECLSLERNMRKQGKKYALCSGFKLTFKPSVRIVIIEDWREPFDVLIMEKFVRTFKLLLAICRGAYIVKPSWVIDSEYNRVICSIQKHSLQFPQKEIIQHSLEKVRKGFKVFQGLKFYFIQVEKFHVSLENIESLIEAGGGMVLTDLRKIVQTSMKNFIMIVSNEYGHAELQFLMKYPECKAYQLELILDACFKQEINWDQNAVIKLK